MSINRERMKERAKFNDDNVDFERLSQCGLDDAFARNILLNHKNCYATFTTPSYTKRLMKKYNKHLSTDADSPSTSQAISPKQPEPKRRISRSIVSRFNSDLCIFCQTTAKGGKRREEKLHNVSVKGVSSEIIKASESNYVMRCRLAGYIDLIAADAKYHDNCKKAFFRRVRQGDDGDSVGSPSSLSLKRIAEEVRRGLRRGEIYTLHEVWLRYCQILTSLGGTTGAYDHNKTKFKQRLVTLLRGEVEFIPQLSPQEPQLLYPVVPPGIIVQALKAKTDEVEEIEIEDELTQSDLSDEDTQLFISVHHVALKIRNDIKNHGSFNLCGSINKEDAAKLVPKTLHLLLQILLTGDYATDDADNQQDGNVVDISDRVLSISQDILSAVSKGKIVTPKHVGLAMTVHQATRSKELVTLVHAAGHSISYDKVRQVDTTIAKKELEDFHANGNISIPSNIQSGRFFQFAADNIDVIEDTLDGKGTFHATQMLIFQRGPGTSASYGNTLPILSQKTLNVPEEFHTMQKAPAKKARPTPQFQTDITTECYKTSKDTLAETKDLAYVLAKIKTAENDDQLLPLWTAFNQSTSKSSSAVSITGFLPIINAPAHENDTLWTVIMRALQISHIKNPGQSTVITLDEQLYCKAKELQWHNPDTCKQLVLRLGSFHIILTYLKVIGKHYKDSGLEDVWVESSVYGENTAHNIMEGKSYNRSVRAHKLTYDALWRIIWPLFLKWAEETEIIIPDHLHQLTETLIHGLRDAQNHESNSLNLSCLVDAILQANLVHHIKEFIKTLPSSCRYWWEYLQMVSILLQFIRAEREGNWKMHLSAFGKMLPWFAVYDHINYTRWGTVYLADMANIDTTHPDVYGAFQQGDFVVKKTAREFNQLSTDQALEQVNKKCKVAGGLTGITRVDSARDRWCITFNQRSRLADETYIMFGLESVDDISDHNKASPSRIKRDEDDVNKIKDQFDRFGVFDASHPSADELVCLSTKDVAPNAVKNAILTANLQGQEIITSFVSERLSTEDFHKAITKVKSLTLHSMYMTPPASSSSTNQKQKNIKGDRKLFQRLLIAKDAGRDVDLKEILTHELSSAPLSIAHPGGKLKTPNNKADLANIIVQGKSLPDLGDSQLSTCVIIDGQALVQAIGKPKKATNFGHVAEEFKKSCFSSFRLFPNCTRVDVTFDRYIDNSIKSGTREKRSGSKKKSIRKIIENPSVPVPDNWKSFINMPDNKSNLACFLSSTLMENAKSLDHNLEFVMAGGFKDEKHAKSSLGREVNMMKSNHEEADTRIILHALSANINGYNRTIIRCKDTDVLVLLVHFREHLSKEVWMQTGTKDAPKFIPVHDIDLPTSLVKNLPSFHALSGCDTISQFQGIAKKTAWKVYEKNGDLLDGLGKEPLTPDTQSKVEVFVCKLYSSSTSITSADSLRNKLFMQGKKDPEQLPPTSDALQLHIKRAHYQSLVWLNSSVPQPIYPPTTNYGWNINPSGELVPTLSTKDAVPQTCVELVFCRCKSSCSSANCGCRARGLRCTSACNCADGICHNMYNIDDNEDDS